MMKFMLSELKTVSLKLYLITSLQLTIGQMRVMKLSCHIWHSSWISLVLFTLLENVVWLLRIRVNRFVSEISLNWELELAFRENPSHSNILHFHFKSFQIKCWRLLQLEPDTLKIHTCRVSPPLSIGACSI